ncbi:hypothetical protein HBI12_213770 [Parastagonospora nodorum]|nr:hypothetical protein HBI12_213770 [Parastagonospora nodorum]KAH5397901.1 hypothetical protein HBI47_209440 [Parastagonospora nodorum]
MRINTQNVFRIGCLLLLRRPSIFLLPERPSARYQTPRNALLYAPRTAGSISGAVAPLRKAAPLFAIFLRSTPGRWKLLASRAQFVLRY